MLKKLLREKREASGLSRADVAEFLRVSPETVKFWEIGFRRPNIERLESIAKLYQVEVADFFPRATETAEGGGE